MHVQVLRAFPGSEPVGTVCDTADWPVNRAHQLTKRRFVQPVIGPAQAPGELKRGPGRPRKEVTP